MSTTIGLDVSLDVCKAEGYMMLDFDKEFTPDESFRVFSHYPEYTGLPGLRVDTLVTFNELVDWYKQNKKSCDSYAETDKYINFDNPNEYDLLNLASDLDGAVGLP
jgi:hypothetical protein